MKYRLPRDDAGARAARARCRLTVHHRRASRLLRCLKTAGSHRRFTRTELERWRREHAGALDEAGAPRLEHAALRAWLDRLVAQPDSIAIVGELYSVRSRLGAWWRVAEELGRVLEALGRRWADGRLTILEEHAVSEGLSRAIARVAEALPAHASAPEGAVSAGRFLPYGPIVVVNKKGPVVVELAESMTM